MKKILFAVAVLAASSGAVGYSLLADHTHDENSTSGYDIRNDHSGGTNSAGCHNETATGGYHCH